MTLSLAWPKATCHVQQNNKTSESSSNDCMIPARSLQSINSHILELKLTLELQLIKALLYLDSTSQRLVSKRIYSLISWTSRKRRQSKVSFVNFSDTSKVTYISTQTHSYTHTRTTKGAAIKWAFNRFFKKRTKDTKKQTNKQNTLTRIC